jgi:hypothetical protein
MERLTAYLRNLFHGGAMTMATMFPQISRIFMIPAVATPAGQEWARGRLDTFIRLTDHIGEATRTVPYEGAHQVVIDPPLLRMNLLRQSRATERGSSRKLEPPYNEDERKFFELIDTVSEKALIQLRQGASSSLSKDGWAMVVGGNALFLPETGVPQFLGLKALGTLKQVLARLNGAEPEALGFEAHVDDLIGAGVILALNVYLGLEELGPQRKDLVPHRFHRVDWRERLEDGFQESHAWLVGSFGIDPR